MARITRVDHLMAPYPNRPSWLSGFIACASRPLNTTLALRQLAPRGRLAVPVRRKPGQRDTGEVAKDAFGFAQMLDIGFIRIARIDPDASIVLSSHSPEAFTNSATLVAC